MQAEHPAYFVALKQHPRLLVGKEVPAIGREGMETLSDEADARSWQEAMKEVLKDEIVSRAERAMDEQRDFLTTVHASIDLFKNNPDLIPNTKQFDSDLATRLTSMLEPYELRVEGKLQGYSIDVQPFVNKLRTELVAERAAAASSAASPPAASATPPAGAAAAPPAAADSPTDQPQAGITSKAGQGSDGEDFSTLFGTLGLPGLSI